MEMMYLFRPGGLRQTSSVESKTIIEVLSNQECFSNSSSSIYDNKLSLFA